MKPYLELFDHPTEGSGLYRMTYAFADDIYEALKAFPGCRYAPELGKPNWIAPMWADAPLKQLAQSFGYGFKNHGTPHHQHAAKYRIQTAPKGQPKLYPYQRDTVKAALSVPAFLCEIDMGLGKTRVAIEMLRALWQAKEAECAIVICPANVCGQWRDEFAKWWPAHPSIEIIRHTMRAEEIWKDLDTNPADIVIVSWDRAKHLLGVCPDVLICDESHMLNRPSNNKVSARAAAVKELRQTNPAARVLFLTGTPVTDTVKGFFGQLDTLYPGLFGPPSGWKFNWRYSEAVENEYSTSGYKFTGINDETADEFKERMQHISKRVTDADVAHLLPPLRAQTIYVDAPRDWRPQDLLDGFEEQHRLHDQKFSSFLAQASDIKVSASIGWAMNTATQKDHFAIVTYRVETAEHIAEALDKKLDHHVQLITGKHVANPENRTKLLKQLKKNSKTVVVASMKSIGIGLDVLAFWRTALFAELYWRPADMLQAIKRFHRLSSEGPVNLYFLLARATIDEAVMLSLKRKIDDANKVIRGGDAEAGLQAALDFGQEDEETFARRMAAVASGFIGGDEYA